MLHDVHYANGQYARAELSSADGESRKKEVAVGAMKTASCKRTGWDVVPQK